MITRGMVDEIQYNQTGNQVTLVKWFNGAKRGTAAAGGGGSVSPQIT
jgi:hypothetical protein